MPKKPSVNPTTLETFQTLFIQSPHSTQVFSPNGETVLVNDAWEKLWKISWEDLKRYNILKDRQLTELGLMSYIKRGFKGESVRIPVRKYEPAKTVDVKGSVPFLWVSASMYSIKDDHGNVEFVILQHRNVTKAVQKREALQDSERLFKSIVENSLIGFRLINEKGDILYASPSTYTLLGYSVDEFKKLNVIDLVHPDDQKEYKRVLKHVLRYPKSTVTLEYRIRHKNGSWRWMEGQGRNFLSDPDIHALISTYQDVTQRKEFEEKLWTTNQTLNAIIQASPLAIYVVDTKGKVKLWSKAAEDMFGWKSREVVGKQLPIVQAGKIDEFAGLMKLLLAGKSFTRETLRQRKDGSQFDVSISAAPIFDEEKNVVNIVAITTDISDRKYIERQKDDFMGIVSHELKTPVTSLKAYEQVLQNRFRKSGDTSSVEMLEKMDGQIDKLTTLIRDLLDVTRIEAGKLMFHEEEFEFDGLVKETIEEVQRTTDVHAIRLEGVSGKKVVGDRDRIGQVIINFLTNAIKYSPDNEDILVHIKKSRSSIECSVRDSGVGIPKSQQAHIFERFYRVTEQETMPGIGLGLYISKEIIIRQGGSIWVESTPKKGSTFHFKLPLKRS